MTKKKETRGRPKGVHTKISGKGCRAKGHSFERWVAEKFRKIFPDAKRHLEYQMGEANGCDLANTGEWLVQCKRNRKYANPNKILEVQVCPIEGGTPVLVTKGDDLEPMACLPFRDFLRLLAFYEANKGDLL